MRCLSLPPDHYERPAEKGSPKLLGSEEKSKHSRMLMSEQGHRSRKGLLYI